MAESLFVSEATIKTHLRSLLDELELRTRLQLVAFAHERRLLGTWTGNRQRLGNCCGLRSDCQVHPASHCGSYR
jgi:hypothetical protein